MIHATTDKAFPWHSGEIAVQERLGVAERMAKNGSRVVRDHMPDQHREFYGQIPFMMIGTVDSDGDVWASMVIGEPGFMKSPGPRELTVDFLPDRSDPAASGLNEGDAIGMLGIELSTRRRNRMNGIVHSASASGFAVRVGHSFGNCPQYIQLRDFEFVRSPKATVPIDVEELDALDDEARAAIAKADTFFVASYVDLEEERQVDVSHRGGKPGFVRIDEDGRLTIPDFAGNLHYNTLGNFTANPRAGLIFADFETGDVLQLTGDPEIVFDSPEIANFQGAERLWHFAPRRIIRRRGVLPIRWKLREDGFSPNSLMTGSWEETAARIEARALATAWRPMIIDRIVDETPDIRSFYLKPADDLGTATFKAGQHLPVRVGIPGQSEPVMRTYTLSSAPSDDMYRLSVKRQGLFSNHLHSMKEGDTIEARGPAGDFFVEGDEKRPAVLIAAGVGITPMLSMLRQIVFEGKRTRGTRPTWLIHAARNRELRPFHDEIGKLVREAKGAVRFIVVHDEPGKDEEQGEDFSWKGRFSASDLARFLPFGDYDFYMCGPPGFMQATYDGLRGMNVSDGRIHAEAFGPASLTRRPDEGAPEPEVIPAATESVPVIFAGSSKEARWEPGEATLLELAEARGIEAPFSCRRGTCGMCAAKLLKGKVAYVNEPSVDITEGEVLVCSAVPHRDSEQVEIEL